MIFIEVQPNEDAGALARRIQATLTPIREGGLPRVRCGRAIIWRGKRFQQVVFLAGSESLEYESNFFELAGWQLERAMIMVGSLQESVFTTPPQDGEEPAAHFKGGGRGAPQYWVRPFNLPDYEEAD